MVKTNRETEAAPMSSTESDSDASSSSSEGKGVPSTPSSAVNKSAARKKPTEPSPANKGIAAGDESADFDSDSQMVADGSKQKKRALLFEFDGDDSKRPKKKRGEQVGADEEGKKSAIKRLWSDEDEIVLLKGILEFKEKKGVDPMNDGDLFHNFIKKSLQVKVNRKQVIDKIRKLKMRYDNSVVKKKSFSGNEQGAFDLSAKIWGKDAADVDPPTTKSNMKPRTGSKAAASKDAKNGDAKGAKEVEANDSETAVKQGISLQSIETDDPGNGKANKEGGSWRFVGKTSIAMGLDENIVKVGLELCSDDRKTEIDNKWKQIYLEESDFFLRKLDLAREETRLINEALKSVEK